MPDDITIGTGVSPGTATISADEVDGRYVQRVKLTHGVDGTATDASATAPLPTADAAVRDRLPPALVAGGVPVTPTGPVPVSGPLTDTQLRASSVPVGVQGTVPVSGPLTDAQLRAARVPVDTGTTGTSSTGARVVLGATTAAAVTHLYDDPGSSPAAAPARTARMVGDAETGASFPAAASVRWNGSAWSRSRTSTVAPQALLTSVDRAAATAGGTFAFPSFATYDCPALLMMLHVTGIGTGALNLTVKALGSNATLAALNVAPASVTGAATGNPVDVCLMLGASAAYGGAPTGGSVSVPAVRFGVSAAPIPAPGQIAGYVQHTDTSTWTYSLDFHLIA